MSEQLIIRLGSQADQAIWWLVWSNTTQDVIASGQLHNAAELAELAQRMGNRPVTALVPACDVVLKEVQLPTKPSRQLLQALPFMLEEEQAEEIEQLLVVQGAALQREQQYFQQVAVVRRSSFHNWLDWLQQAGFKIRQMLPDALLLPDLDQPVAIELGHQWLLKRQPWQVSCVESSWWPDYLAVAAIPEVLSFSPWPEQVVQPHQLAPAELPLALLAKQLATCSFNLLQGEYAPKKPQNIYWQQWRLSGSLAAACGLLYLLGLGLEIVHFQSQADMARQAATELYQQQFPGERIVNLKRQVDRKLAASGGAGHADLLHLLAVVQPALQQDQPLTIDNLKYDSKKSELRFQATSTGFQSFEQLKNAIQQQGYNVEQGALSQVNGQVQGTMTLRSKS